MHLRYTILNLINKWIKRIKLGPDPSFNCGVENMVGKSTNFIDFKIMLLSVNWDMPEIGDLIIVCTEDGMGTQIIKEERIKVVGYKEWGGYTGEPRYSKNANKKLTSIIGHNGSMHLISYMRRHGTIPRVWFKFD